MKNYKDFKQYFTKEEWEKFEANMSPDRKYERDAEPGTIDDDSWGQLQGLKRFQRHNVRQYINDAFPWDETPEGRDYWLNLKETLYKREFSSKQ
jgi:hypothetical protein